MIGLSKRLELPLVATCSEAEPLTPIAPDTAHQCWQSCAHDLAQDLNQNVDNRHKDRLWRPTMFLVYDVSE